MARSAQSDPACARNALLNRQALALASGPFRQRELQDAVLVPCLGVAFIDIGGKRNASGDGPKVALAVHGPTVLFLSILLLDFGPQPKDVALQAPCVEY